MLKIEREQKTPLIVRESKQAKLPKVATGKKVLESLFATMEEQGYGEGLIEISLYDYAKLLLASIMKIRNMYEPEEY
jgi:hypothetical protein